MVKKKKFIYYWFECFSKKNFSYNSNRYYSRQWSYWSLKEHMDCAHYDTITSAEIVSVDENILQFNSTSIVFY